MQWFFYVSGALFWLVMLILIVVNIVQQLKEKDDSEPDLGEYYCSECDKETLHREIGSGFNAELICQECNNPESETEEYYCECYCSECDKETTHEERDYGFNTKLVCQECNNEK